jgi:putative DNA primase/helicase
MLESNGASVVAPKIEDLSQNTATGSSSSTKYIRSSIKSPCPVCGRVKDRDCSLHPDGKTAHCKTYVSGIGHDESQWHYNGTNKQGFQGIFVFKQVESEFVKSPRPKSSKSYDYPNRDGSPLLRVNRIDRGDGQKNFYQQHWDGNKWVNGNPEHIKRLIPIYRYLEVQQAIERQELIFVVEGEATADALWAVGIVATTTIGGSGGYANYGSYLDDLLGARLVLSPDRDPLGIKYMSEFERDFSSQVEGWYLAGTVGLWKNPQGGMDIGDDISDRHYTKDQILAKVISPQDYRQIVGQTSPTEDPKPTERSFQFSTSITDGLFKNNLKLDLGTGELKLLPERIGNHLEAIAYVNNPNGDAASIHIEFKTIRNKLKRWTMPRGAIVCETSQMLAELQNRGYFFDISKKKQLVEYLNGLGGDVATTYTITDTTGWIDGAYVTQNKTYSLNGDSDLKFRDVEPIADSISEIKGTLAEWQDKIGSLCAGNSRLIFALATGLAAPLQPLVDVESGGFHMVGTTSVGKTTMLRVGSSVVGIKDIPHWRTTTNGLESIACAHNHMLLPLDEIAQAEAREVGAIAYMLANGQGKTRMTKNLTNRKPKTWQLLFLSSGELGMGAYMAQSGIALKGGQEVRLPDIPAVPSGSAFGAFESIHNFESAKQFAEHLDRATQTYHGTLLDAFLPKLVTNRATNPDFANTLKKQVYAIARKLSEGTIDTAVARVANRFALVQVALELAHAYGLLPFPLEHIGWAIGKMFRDWLDYRGGDGSIEVKNACDRIRNLFVTQEYGDRIYNLSDGDAQSVRNLLAYRKTNEDGETEEFWVPTSVFDLEICTGVDKPALIKELQKRGWLAPPRNDGKSTLQRRIKKRRNYYYVFQPQNIFGENSSESGESGESVVYNSLPTISTAPDILTHQHKSSSESGESVKEVVNGSDSLDSPRLTEAVSQNGNSQLLSKQPSQPSDSPVSPDSPAKVQSQETGDGYLSPPLNKGDKVIVQTSQAVGVVIDRRIKNHRSPKKGVFPVSQYLIEFEEGNRTWLDGEVLALGE